MADARSILLKTEEVQRLHVSLKPLRKLSTKRSLTSEEDLEDLESSAQTVSRMIARLRKRWEEPTSEEPSNGEAD